MSLTELPFGLPGRLFRSPMPFGPYDLHGEVYDRFRQEQISVIVLLATEDECLYKTGRNLRALYLREGWTVLYLPIPDFGVPAKEDLAQVVTSTIAYAHAGHHIAIHCSAGPKQRTNNVWYLMTSSHKDALHSSSLKASSPLLPHGAARGSVHWR